MADALLWAYGVVPGPAAPPARGVAGRPVTPIAHGKLAVLASAAPFSAGELQQRLEDMETLASLARAHDAVLEAAFDRGDVVPFRMGTLYETPQAIRDMLAAETDRFAAVLTRLHDKAEWGVKAFLAPPRSEPSPSSGTEYLARRRAQRDQTEESSEAAADVHARLAEYAAGAVLSRLQDRGVSGRDTEMVLNGSYLVPRAEAADFAALVEALGREHQGLTLELTGPWPPYHFVA
ncbi:GvpL/GvpF family gas vesicle protein [Candidatus Solirubrobacter pratensis]|uniref:GvpL/GvpF family gas vesicle protein n=1 Tax=Candidatus Solirubrobacter pratensis TaxID=1298857 RepID=UPI00041762D7|nr:GvpL/GvpF family gas vesicle protein [Candidatus Solirubrobacter pratensis]